MLSRENDTCGMSKPRHNIAPSAGYNAQWVNGGQFTNKGAEISLSATPVQLRNGFTWISTTSFYRNYSNVDHLPKCTDAGVGTGCGFPAGPQFGGPFGTFWVQQGKSISWVVNTSALNAAGVPLGVGNSQPDYVMSFGNEFNFKRFHVYGQVDWRRGGTTSNLTNQYFDFGPGSGLLADTAGTTKRLTQLFTNGLCNGNPSLTMGGCPWVESSTYLKVREITVSYDLPTWLVSRFSVVQLSSARLQVSGRNLFMNFKYSGLDPEVSNFGNTNLARGQEVTPYPPARSLFVSLDLGF